MIFKYDKNVKQDYIQHPELSAGWRYLDDEDFCLNIWADKRSRRVDPYMKSSPINQKISYINNIFRDVEDFDDER